MVFLINLDQILLFLKLMFRELIDILITKYNRRRVQQLPNMQICPTSWPTS